MIFVIVLLYAYIGGVLIVARILHSGVVHSIPGLGLVLHSIDVVPALLPQSFSDSNTTVQSEHLTRCSIATD